MLSKLALSGALQSHADSLRLANVVRVLARAHDLATPFRELTDGSPPSAFGPALGILQDRSKVVHVADQLYLTLLRSALTDSLELTRDYCRRTDQTSVLKAQAWFHVFRLLRNALNHNFRFEFKPEDRKLLPLTWGSITITAALEGTELTQDVLTPVAAIEWLSELDDFIERGLR